MKICVSTQYTDILCKLSYCILQWCGCLAMLGEGAYMATSGRWLALLLDVCGQWEVGPCSAALGNMLNGLDLIVSVWRGDVFCFNAWLLSSSLQ